MAAVSLEEQPSMGLLSLVLQRLFFPPRREVAKSKGPMFLWGRSFYHEVCVTKWHEWDRFIFLRGRGKEVERMKRKRMKKEIYRMCLTRRKLKWGRVEGETDLVRVREGAGSETGGQVPLTY